MAARLERLISIETKGYKIRSPLLKRSIQNIEMIIAAVSKHMQG